MKELLREYRESLRLTKQMREEAPEEDQKIYASMISNLEYAIKWMRDERCPAPAKKRIVLFSKPKYIETLKFSNAFGFNGNEFEEVERRIDEERMSANLG